MHQHTSKRREVAFRFFIYGVMSVAVIVISLICILLVLGYRFDQVSGRVEQQALLQFRSFPNNAAVFVDGKDARLTTPEKMTISPGHHTVRFTRPGYHDWNKTFTVKSGDLLWLNYARLIPTEITTEAVAHFPKLASTLASPDRRWIALLSDAKKPTLTFADIRNEAEPVVNEMTLPPESYTMPGRAAGSLSFVEWDFGSRFMLAKYTVGTTTEYLRIDRTDPSATINISRQLRIGIDDIHFIGTSGNVLFALSQGTIRKIDLQAGTISRPLVTDADSFILYKEDTIAFTGTRNNQRIVGMYKDGKSEKIIKQFPNDRQPLFVTASNYFYDDYMAIAHGTNVEILKDPYGQSRETKTVASFTFTPGVATLRFSSNGRFVLAQNGGEFTSYDLETSNKAQADMTDLGKPSGPLRWLDDYYVWNDAGGKLHIAEFDGTNQRFINAVAPGYDVTLSENGKRIFSIGRNQTTKQFVLQSAIVVPE
ncbi:MAG TPA: PEGA domain-containing protein [Verrucomicrobiae bacterium]|nr:PEGA domain-containing protein [Verrucomicrobiae bacterium]